MLCAMPSYREDKGFAPLVLHIEGKSGIGRKKGRLGPRGERGLPLADQDE